jgi:hypothetical protein
MTACGIDYNMASFTPNNGGWNMRDFYDAADLRIMLNPASAWHWKSEHLPKTGLQDVPMPIWEEDFFPGLAKRGSAAFDRVNGDSVDAFRFWDTIINPRNTGGYIIGNHWAGNNDIDNNWVSIKKYRAFNVGNGQGDSYYVRFLMKRLNSLPDQDDTLLTLHTGNWRDGAPPENKGTYYKRCNEIPTDWGWVEFDCDSIIIGNRARFALQWHGKQDSGDVKIRAISFQSNTNRLLFPNPDNPDSAGGAIWNAFMDGMTAAEDSMNGRVLGFMAKEPWKYSWHTYNVIRDYLENSIGGNYLYSAMDPGAETVARGTDNSAIRVSK